MLVASDPIKFEFVISHCTFATSVVAYNLDDDLVPGGVLILNEHTLSSDVGASEPKHSTYNLFDLEIKMDRFWELIGLVDVYFATASKKGHSGIPVMHFFVKNVVF